MTIDGSGRDISSRSLASLPAGLATAGNCALTVVHSGSASAQGEFRLPTIVTSGPMSQINR